MKLIGQLRAVVGAAVWLMHAGAGSAQVGTLQGRPASDAQVSAQPKDNTLEVPSRAAPEYPASVEPPLPDESSAPPSTGTSINNPQDAAQPEKDGDSGSRLEDAREAAPKLPYLGISVQYIASDDPAGHQVQGFEIVAVDPASPAENAGVHGRGAATRIGASGATAGALMPPLDLVLTPLLKKAGKLGADGDLIVAIDDDRVESQDDLQNVLAKLKPGDTIYLTIVRQHQGSLHQTLKLPVRLGAPRGLTNQSPQPAQSPAPNDSG